MKLSQQTCDDSFVRIISVTRGTMVDGTSIEPRLVLITKNGDIELCSNGLISSHELQARERDQIVQVKGKKVGKTLAVDELKTVEVFSDHIRPTTGEQPWVVLLCQFADSPDGSIQSKAWFENIVSDVRPGLGHFFSDISYGTLNTTFDVQDWRRLPKDRAEYPSDERDLLIPCTDLYPEIDFTQYYGVIMVVDQTLIGVSGLGTGRTATIHGDEQFWGLVWLGSNGGWNNSYVWAQEMGHTYGLKHTLLKSDMSSRSGWDFMGTVIRPCNENFQDGCLPQHTTGYHKDSIGWLDESRTITISESIQELRIASLSNAGESGYLYAKIMIPGETDRYYAIESRQRNGYDNNYPREAPDSTVVIHEIDQNLNPESYTIGAFTAGSRLEGENVWIDVLEASGTGHIIQVTYAPRPPNVLLEFVGCISRTAKFLPTIIARSGDTVTSLQASVRYQGSLNWVPLLSTGSTIISANSNQRVYLRARACNDIGCSKYASASGRRHCNNNPEHPL